jgi:hypothetical protein
LTTVTPEEAHAVSEAGALLAGQTVVVRWDSMRFKSEEDAPGIGSNPEAREVDLDHYYEIRIVSPLIVKVGDQEFALGATVKRLLSVAFVQEGHTVIARPFLHDTAYLAFAPDEPVPDRNHQPVQGMLLGAKAEAVAQQVEPVAEHEAQK